jgi:hypothetical protein
MIARLKAATTNLFLAILLVIWWRYLMGVTAVYRPLQWFFTLALAPFVIIYLYRAFTLRIAPDSRWKERPEDRVESSPRDPEP